MIAFAFRDAAALLPVIAYVAIAAAVAYRRPTTADRMEIGLDAAVVWGFLLVATTEFLSLARAVNWGALVGSWSGVIVVALFMAARYRRPADRRAAAGSGPPAPAKRGERLLLAGVLSICGVTGLIAVVAPPNTFDSMTYHMSRVAHWAQDGNVAHYPTHIPRQLFLMPGAEFIILHFQVLSGGDRLANLAQWFSMTGTLVGVAQITKRLGGDRAAQLLSAAVAAAVPMGVLQASSTQNDYVVTFWLVAFVNLVLRFSQSASTGLALLTGSALGLALLTKGTAYFYAFPFVIWLSASQLRRNGGSGFARLAVIALAAVVINIGHLGRNVAVFESPWGPSTHVSRTTLHKIANDTFSPSTTFSNVVRNLALHLGTPFPRATNATTNAVRSFLDGLGMSPNDPASTWPPYRFRIPITSGSEDSDGNLLHLALYSVALIGLALAGVLWRPPLFGLLIGLAAGFVFFCLYLRWTLWNTRYHLPLFLLAAPFAGLFLAARSRRGAMLIVALVLISALPWLVANQARPLINRVNPEQNVLAADRNEMYFNRNPKLKDSYLAASEYLRARQCRSIGLQLDNNDYEYPFWVLLNPRGGSPTEIRHVNVWNETSVLADDKDHRFDPCAIVVTDMKAPRNDVIHYADRSYGPGWTSPVVAVYVPLSADSALRGEGNARDGPERPRGAGP